MILGFLGKGGSGKSTTATQMALHMHARNFSVLAVDADHNMDFAYNIYHGDIPSDMHYFGGALTYVLDHVGLASGEKYDRAFLGNTDARFHIFPHDACTQMLAHPVSDRFACMAAGPQTDMVLYGQSCSHILTTPLKVFLPLLELADNQVVIVDEKAGADGVSTGIVTGIDVGIIVCEPALHSIKIAQQIADLMKFYETPYIFVGNKVSSDEDRAFLHKHFGDDMVYMIPTVAAMKQDPFAYHSELAPIYDAIYARATELNEQNRLERTTEKFMRNHSFQNT
ncbi:MAG: hypothetical protein LRY41_02270 [Candidatus Pacebacteria bacterium]|nr:hypothetical protein [Candidatus Paceibacterota bacterium]MCD8508418.1 hypothetical protein [Candidatus Paceibacterota bacterium]MCD8528132.1 hypothetical protein [Candidatus Paceibacterota bacterium]MCD8563508.1 hypothetical protein [Candidatus Paceibacterota bacterium]